MGKGGFGVHHRAVAKLPEHCANLVVGWLVGGEVLLLLLLLLTPCGCAY